MEAGTREGGSKVDPEPISLSEPEAGILAFVCAALVTLAVDALLDWVTHG